MKFEFRTIDCRTLKGIKSAERLQRQGWTPIAGTLFSPLTMQRQKKKIERKQKARI